MLSHKQMNNVLVYVPNIAWDITKKILLLYNALNTLAFYIEMIMNFLV